MITRNALRLPPNVCLFCRINVTAPGNRARLSSGGGGGGGAGTARLFSTTLPTLVCALFTCLPVAIPRGFTRKLMILPHSAQDRHRNRNPPASPTSAATYTGGPPLAQGSRHATSRKAAKTCATAFHGTKAAADPVAAAGAAAAAADPPRRNPTRSRNTSLSRT